MKLTALQFDSLLHTAALLDLLQKARSSQPDDYPGMNDMRELLARPGIAADICIWQDEGGKLAAFAVADPFNNLLVEGEPSVLSVELFNEMADWAAGRLRERANPGEEIPSLDAVCRAQDAERAALLESAGFHAQALRTLRFRCELDEPIPAPSLPEGFLIRPIDGEREYPAWLEIHHSAFGTETMSREERAAMAHNPGYVPDLDLVCVSPDGRLAGYCFCGIEEGVGYTDPVAVHPDFQGRGLAVALLLAGLARLKQAGVHAVELGTSSQNTAMAGAARKAGFTLVMEKVWYSKTMS